MEDQLCESIRNCLERDGTVFSLTEIEEALNFLNNMSSSLIIVNVPTVVFDNYLIKEKFESFFLEHENSIKFSYLKSFRRIRLDMSCSDMAIIARFRFNNMINEWCTESSDCHSVLLEIIKLGKENNEDEYLDNMRCFFAQDLTIETSNYLELPKLDKQFLISPPASPPVGWEPKPEGEPIINYDLLAALAALNPGESHELHPPTVNYPGIVITPCPDDDDGNSCFFSNRPQGKIVQTRCPDRQ